MNCFKIIMFNIFCTDNTNDRSLLELAKLRALRAYVPTCLACLRFFALCVLTCSHANESCVLICSRANVPCTCKAHSRAQVATCLACSRAQVLTCLVSLRAHVITWSLANISCMLCVPTCSRALTTNDKDKFSMKFFPYIFVIVLCIFSMK